MWRYGRSVVAELRSCGWLWAVVLLNRHCATWSYVPPFVELGKVPNTHAIDSNISASIPWSVYCGCQRIRRSRPVRDRRGSKKKSIKLRVARSQTSALIINGSATAPMMVWFLVPVQARTYHRTERWKTNKVGGPGPGPGVT